MELRPYQTDVLARVREHLSLWPILVAPTGSGKTVMGSELVRTTPGSSLWVAHRRELIGQAAERLYRFGLEVGVIMGGQTPNPRAQVQVASIQTLQNRAMPPVDGVVVIDECHHARADSYQGVVEYYGRERGIPIVGLTATPFRLDGKGLGDIFRRIEVAATPRGLCDDGTLMEPLVYAHPAPSMDGVKKVHGDYSSSQSYEKMHTTTLIGDIVATWTKLAAGKRTVVFAVNVAHSQEIVEAFTKAGIPAEHLDGGTAKTERDAILSRLRSGQTLVVSNCQVVTEGWDLPALEVAIIARPTASLCMHIQMIGRIMRAADGKARPIVLDHAGNHNRLGTVTQDLEYTLDGPVKRAKDADPRDTIKSCPGCYVIVPLQAKSCPNCGHLFTGTQREILTEEGELALFEGLPQPTWEEQEQYWMWLQGQMGSYGYQPGWAMHRFKDRFGSFPTVVDNQLVNTRKADMDQKRRVYDDLLATAKAKGYKAGWAAHRYKMVYGVWPRTGRGVGVA